MNLSIHTYYEYALASSHSSLVSRVSQKKLTSIFENIYFVLVCLGT